jgi:hypothetical protein
VAYQSADKMDKNLQFLVMRTFRIGRATAADLIEVSGVSTATATRAMGAAVQNYPVRRVKRTLQPALLACVPDFASEAALLNCLDKGLHDPMDTGLMPRELPITYVSWSNTLPPKAGVFNTIVQAIAQQKEITIAYQGMKLNEPIAEKFLFPLGLEKMNDQWRLIAQDIRQSGAPVRVYVLSRIFDAAMTPMRKPNYGRMNDADAIESVPVRLNPLMTPRQQEAVAKELRVENGIVKIASRSKFEFFRRFTDAPASVDAVWPPLLKKQRQ